MAVETPEDWIEFATNSTALSTDPGSPLTADGWAVGDAPAASHFNYIMNHAAGNATFVGKNLASSVAWGNIDYELSAAAPWGTACTLFHCFYSDTTNRWYVVRVDTANSYVDIFDSETGDDGTWTSSLNLHGSAVTDLDVTLPVLGRGILAMGVHNKIFTSTNGTVRNLGAAITPFAQIARVREMAYDETNDLWIAAGSNGSGDGRIETCPGNDLTDWTVRDSLGTIECESMAHDRATGRTYVSTDAFATNRDSGDGVTWDAGGDPGANPFYRVWWDEFTQTMLGQDSAQNIYFSTDSGQSWTDAGFNCSNMMTTSEFTWLRDSSGVTRGVRRLGTYVGYDIIGTSFAGPPFLARYSYIRGSSSKLMFPYGATCERAVTHFGAKNNG